MNEIEYKPAVVEIAEELGTTIETIRSFAVEHPETFWESVAKNFGPKWMQPYDQVKSSSNDERFDIWFPNAQLNLADWLLRQDLPHGDPVIRYLDEDGSQLEISRIELKRAVVSAASELRNMSVGRGSRVVFVATAHWSTTAFILGALSLGATCIPIFSGYGIEGMRQRIEMADPDVLVAQDGTYRKGKFDAISERVAEAIAEDHHKLIIVKTTSESSPKISGRTIEDERLLYGEESEFSALPVPADEPAFILTTSGSSGNPKQVTLTHGGFGAQSASEWGLHLDLHEKETVLWPADVAWLVGPWSLIGVLGLGGCMLQVSGNVVNALKMAPPDWHPSILGGSPTFLSAVVDDLGTLNMTPRLVATAGEPLVETTWRKIHESFGPNVPIINMAGGTEVGGCLLASLPTDTPVPGGFGGPCLGAQLDIVDDAGTSTMDEQGHLVCRNDWPGRAKSVTSNQASLETYYERFGIWEQGDTASRSEDGWFIRGRSDEVMKIAGRRIGPSDVERAATAVDGVDACVSAPLTVHGNSKLVCLAILREKSEGRTETINAAIVNALGAAFRPVWIGTIIDPPLTTSGKIDRGALRRRVVGSVENVGSLKEGITRLDSVFGK